MQYQVMYVVDSAQLGASFDALYNLGLTPSGFVALEAPKKEKPKALPAPGKKKIKDIVLEALAHGPMSRKDLLKKIEARGFKKVSMNSAMHNMIYKANLITRQRDPANKIHTIYTLTGGKK